MKHTLYKVSLSILFITAIFQTACTSKTDNPAPATAAKGMLYFHLHTYIDTAEADSGQVMTDASGRRFLLNAAQFYISGITLSKADGSTYNVNNVIILKNIDSEVYKIDNVPAGNYTTVSFNIGLNDSLNQVAPSAYTGALAALYPASMWFGNTAKGYMFMNIQGMADTSVADGAVNYPFSYQLGTSNMLTRVMMPEEKFSVIANQVTYVHLLADYGAVLKGVDFKSASTATPFVNVPVAIQIEKNIPDMFRYEE